MNTKLFATRLPGLRFAAFAKVLAPMAALTLTPVPVFAAQLTAQFDVMINIRAPETQVLTGVCDTNTASGSGPSTLVCSARPVSEIATPEPGSERLPSAQSPANPVSESPPTAVNGPLPPAASGPLTTPAPSAKARFQFDGRGYTFISYVTGMFGTVDVYAGAGTSTAFRLVNWADREYIEMTVGW